MIWNQWALWTLPLFEYLSYLNLTVWFRSKPSPRCLFHICVQIWTFQSEAYGHVLIFQTISMTACVMMHLAFRACSTLNHCRKWETSGLYRVQWSSKCVPGNLRVPGYCPRDFSSLNGLNGNIGFNWYILITTEGPKTFFCRWKTIQTSEVIWWVIHTKYFANILIWTHDY